MNLVTCVVLCDRVVCAAMLSMPMQLFSVGSNSSLILGVPDIKEQLSLRPIETLVGRNCTSQHPVAGYDVLKSLMDAYSC